MAKYILITFSILIVSCSSRHSSPFNSPSLCRFNEDSCRLAAVAAAKENSLEWGEPVGSSFEDSSYSYLFTFETPSRESALLGPRAVRVNCVTCSTYFIPRD